MSHKVIVDGESFETSRVSMFIDVIDITQATDRAKKYRAGDKYLALVTDDNAVMVWRCEFISPITTETGENVLTAQSLPWQEPSGDPFLTNVEIGHLRGGDSMDNSDIRIMRRGDEPVPVPGGDEPHPKPGQQPPKED